MVTRIFSGQIKNTVSAHLGPHYLQETLSDERRVYRASHKYFSPLTNREGKQTAFVVISEASIVRKPDELLLNRLRKDKFKKTTLNDVS